MILKTIKGYGYNDVTIVPSVISEIKSRSECFPKYMDGYNYPIFTAPMSTVVNNKNKRLFYNNGIIPIIPRNIDYEIRKECLERGEWVAVSLKEFKNLFVNFTDLILGSTFRVCLDMANGHMKEIYDSINKAKEKARTREHKLIVMTGNIANPETYRWICEHSEVDFIRCSIGSGSGCLTASNTSVHYPIATLIEECRKIKEYINKCERYPDGKFLESSGYKSTPYIIADGGIKNYSDVIKALALGADYVMIGSLFAGLLESAADFTIEPYNSHYNYTYKGDGIINDGINDVLSVYYAEEIAKQEFIHNMKTITKEFYGMSTKKAQKLINSNANLKTSEGCTKYINVTHTIGQWVENMDSYLRSAMSYTNKKRLEDFVGNVDLIVNSASEIYSVNK